MRHEQPPQPGRAQSRDQAMPGRKIDNAGAVQRIGRA